MSRRDAIEEAAALLAEASRTVVFTGAGISAESGIPTYRGHGGATWSKYDPSRYANIESFYSEPEYYWSFFREVRAKVLTECRPNPGHDAIAKLERRGVVRCVITQNIDGLHQLAGSERVLELHGNTRIFDCLRCQSELSLEDVMDLQRSADVPVCPRCEGTLKPRVVFFGEPLDTSVLKEASEEAAACDLMLVVGSTLQVYPAAQLPVIVARRSRPVIIANYGPTQLDSLATCRLEGKAAEILPAVVELVERASRPRP
jgi:NAD-dependent deacetylase